MKNIALFFFTMLVLVLFAGNGFAQQDDRTVTGNGYNPQVKYEGQYKAGLLYFRYRQKDLWRRQPHRDRLESVSCQRALNHLTREGKWQGSLDKYGSCGGSSIESPEWAVGNRLNYDESLQ